MIYRIPYTGTLTNAGGDSDWLYALAADDKPIRLMGMRFSQSTEIGDAQEENLRITIRRLGATVTVGSGGSAVTPIPPRTVDVAAGGTYRCNDTTVSTTSGTNLICEELAWNVRNTPCEFWWEPDLRLQVVHGEALVVRCESTPTDDVTGQLTFFVEEL